MQSVSESWFKVEQRLRISETNQKLEKSELNTNKLLSITIRSFISMKYNIQQFSSF